MIENESKEWPDPIVEASYNLTSFFCCETFEEKDTFLAHLFGCLDFRGRQGIEATSLW